MLLNACGGVPSTCTGGDWLRLVLFPGEWLVRPEDDGTGAFVATLLICPLKIESSSFDFVGPVFENISRRVTVGVAVLYACSAFCNSLSRIGYEGIGVSMHYPVFSIPVLVLTYKELSSSTSKNRCFFEKTDSASQLGQSCSSDLRPRTASRCMRNDRRQ